jgi:hypothetical protein
MDIVPHGHGLAVKAARVPNQTNDVCRAAVRDDGSVTAARKSRIIDAHQHFLRGILQSRKLLCACRRDRARPEWRGNFLDLPTIFFPAFAGFHIVRMIGPAGVN